MIFYGVKAIMSCIGKNEFFTVENVIFHFLIFLVLLSQLKLHYFFTLPGGAQTQVKFFPFLKHPVFIYDKGNQNEDLIPISQYINEEMLQDNTHHHRMFPDVPLCFSDFMEKVFCYCLAPPNIILFNKSKRKFKTQYSWR